MNFKSTKMMWLGIGLLLVASLGWRLDISRGEIESDLVTNSQEFAEEVGSDYLAGIVVPDFLRRSFPDTDFAQSSPTLEKIISGGPPKDGIPALVNPKFESISDFDRSEEILAIVIEDNETHKVYPYHIMTWHEIVNDVVDGVPVAVTFCPLCGSSIVYDRRLPQGETTFGVSGALIESNMVMYDRGTESLWQQSTGEALAGEYFGESLRHIPFQLLSMGEIKELYPKSLVLSEDTGYRRDYDRNPYSGYETDNNQFAFGVSKFSDEYEAKEIMVVFRVGETPVATPWSSLEEGKDKTAEIDGVKITLTKENGELSILNQEGGVVPFYFEMWFSFAIQHGEVGVTI